MLAHSDNTYDWIELYNTTDSDIDISGWFISDDSTDLKKYEIPSDIPEAIIPAQGYVVFYENIHFGNASAVGSHTPFALSENGETIRLNSGYNGELTGYSEEEDFGASQRNIALGRYYKSSTDTWNFVAMSQNTPGSVNAYPKVGPIVISEIIEGWSCLENEDLDAALCQSVGGRPTTWS